MNEPSWSVKANRFVLVYRWNRTRVLIYELWTRKQLVFHAVSTNLFLVFPISLIGYSMIHKLCYSCVSFAFHGCFIVVLI